MSSNPLEEGHRETRTITNLRGATRYVIGSDSEPETDGGSLTGAFSCLTCVFLFPFDIHASTSSKHQRIQTQSGLSVTVWFPFQNQPHPHDIDHVNLDRVPTPEAQEEPLRSQQRLSHFRTQQRLPGTESLANGLRLDLHSDHPISEPLHTRLEEEAGRLAKLFVFFVREWTNQWWVGAGRDHENSDLRHCFISDELGICRSTVGSRGVSFTGFGIERVFDEDGFDSVCQYIRQGRQPWDAWDHCYDAMYHLAADDISRAVLAAVTAIELERDRVADNLGLRFRGTDLLKHVDRDTKRLLGRSFREDCPSHYRHIKDLWISRGHVAHGKPPSVTGDRGTRELGSRDLVPMLDAALKLLDWIKRLPRG